MARPDLGTGNPQLIQLSRPARQATERDLLMMHWNRWVCSHACGCHGVSASCGVFVVTVSSFQTTVLALVDIIDRYLRIDSMI